MTHAPGYPVKCDVCKAVCHTPKAWKHHRCAREVEEAAPVMTASEAVVDFNTRYTPGTNVVLERAGKSNVLPLFSAAFVNEQGEAVVRLAEKGWFIAGVEEIKPVQ